LFLFINYFIDEVPSMKQILILFSIALLVSTCSSTPSQLRSSASIDNRNHVFLSWTNIDNAKGFEIRRDGKLIGRTGPNETGYTDINTNRGLICENTYVYTITPIGAAGVEGAFIPITTGICPPRNRIALVIGNSNYEKSNYLDNPHNDASAVAEKLRKLGFDVELLLDQKSKEMQMAVEEFGQRLGSSQDEDFGFFYYSGHGYGAENEANYLIPIDDKNLDGYNLGGTDQKETNDDNAISDKLVLVKMDHYNKKGINIAVLDACRDNPPLGNKGFFRTGLETHYGNYISNVVVGFATRAGKVIPNRNHRYSLYTEKLLEALEKSSHKPLINMFQEVEEAVQMTSHGRQTPEHIFFAEGGDKVSYSCLGACL
jgi:hypothetical protein